MAQTIGGAAQGEVLGRKELSSRQVMFIIAVGIGIAGCEYVFAYQNVAYGIAIALALTLLIYLALSIFQMDQRIIDSGESLALIPLYVLFTSSLPWFFINQQYLLPAVYSCVIGLCLWHVHQKKLSLRKLLGLRRTNVNMKRYLLIAVAGAIVVGMGEYFILRPAPAFPTFEVKYFFRDAVYMLLFVGLGEELLFRGLIQQDLVKAFGWKWGLFGASALFAVMHLTWRSIPELAIVFFGGLILGYLYLRTRSLLPPIVMHAVNNVILVAIAPYIFAR